MHIKPNEIIDNLNSKINEYNYLINLHKDSINKLEKISNVFPDAFYNSGKIYDHRISLKKFTHVEIKKIKGYGCIEYEINFYLLKDKMKLYYHNYNLSLFEKNKEKEMLLYQPTFLIINKLNNSLKEQTCDKIRLLFMKHKCVDCKFKLYYYGDKFKNIVPKKIQPYYLSKINPFAVLR